MPIRYQRTGAALWSIFTVALLASALSAQIRPYAENPAYWEYQGEPLLLFGGSDRDNIFQWTGRRLTDHLDLLKQCGGNYIRCTLSSREYTAKGYRWDLLPYPFARVHDRYDLRRWNPEYWNRLRTFLRETKERGIIVQLEIWDRWNESGDSRKPGNGWYDSPWNPDNNVNYDWADSPLLKKGKTGFYNPFHLAAVTDDPVLLPWQQRFVRKIVEEVVEGGFDHVLFQIDNESGIGDASLEPDPYWARFLRKCAKELNSPFELYVCTSRRFHWPTPKQVSRFREWSNPEIRVPILSDAFQFCDISQNNGTSGQEHYDNLLWYRAKVHEHGIRPINHVKCYHFNWPIGARFQDRTAATDAEAGAKFWRAVFAGAASIRFHRDTGFHRRDRREGFGLSPEGQQHLRSMHAFLQEVDLFRMVPRNELLQARSPNEAYCLAEDSRQYAIFFTGDSDATVALTLPQSSPRFRLRWLDVARGTWTEPVTVASGHALRLEAPVKPHAVAVLTAADAPPEPVMLYVSPTGDNSNPGTADRPLRSLQGARDRVRTLPKREATQIVVRIRKGHYFTDETIRFDREDSGPPKGRIRYENWDAPGSAVFIGGKRLADWKDEGDGVYSVQLDRPVFALYENGQAAEMAREPNDYYDHFASVSDFRHLTLPKKRSYRRFDFRSAAVCLWAHWIPAKTKIASVDFTTGTIELERPYAGDLRGTVWDDAWAAKTPTRFYIYNSRAFLDRPGEFFMDLESKRLYYRPRKLPIENQTILAPAVTRLISIENASNLEFRGLAFAVSDGLLDVAPTLPLHANIKGGLIHLRNANRIAIRDCRLSQSGQNGIVVEGGVRDTTISGNEITATTSGGIRFVGGDNRGMLIENNYLHHLGDGIHIFGSQDDRICHNRVDHVGSNGIKSLRSQRQRIEYNDVSRIGLEGTDSDSAGIYVNVTAGGRDGGHITIDHNRIHDLTWNRTPGYPGAAVYLDMDGTYNCTVTNNIIYNLRHKFAIHLRGAHHVVRNNIVHLEGSDLLEPFTLITGYKAANVAVDAPPIHHYDYTIERNIVWCSRKRIFRIRGKVASDTFRSVDHNVYFTPAGEYIFQKMTLKQWQGKGLDRHSRFADPRFVDRHRHDYRLQPDSPARELGFQPIEASRIGLLEGFVYGDKGRRKEEP